MIRLGWQLLDIALHGLHVAVISLCLLGWAVPWLRDAQAGIVVAVALSWFVLGLRWGIGYCLLTDLQWKVKRALGHQALPASYVKYAIDGLAGTDVSPRFIERFVAWGFLFSALAALCTQ